ncbi:hypothetical protein AYJ54_13510 [Bradyrhizobium centrolobii]|uniref:Integrase catalytic domain-containing protein n=1 Tax=Bradyrhizobium centrolobii TaxID=1505087 RepID=A0A176YQT2_9BRAD|nr:hypothetical protein AYJ54_13510 [Bradyrhizobium centrolobii]
MLSKTAPPPQAAAPSWKAALAKSASATGLICFTLAAIALRIERPWPILLTERTSLTPDLRVVRELDAVIATRGCSAMIVSDNGTEFTSMTILRWSQQRQVEWHYIARGKPQQNAFIESFNVSTAACAMSC